MLPCVRVRWYAVCYKVFIYVDICYYVFIDIDIQYVTKYLYTLYTVCYYMFLYVDIQIVKMCS